MKWKKTSFVLIFIVLAVIVYAAVNMASAQSRLREMEREEVNLQEEIEIQKQVNVQLQEDTEALGEETQIKAIAREKLGLIENGAVLFYDVGN